MRARAPAIAALLMLLGAAAQAAPAAALALAPIGEFEQPTYVTSEPDPEVLLVTQRFGQIEIVDHGQVGQLADLSSLVGCPQGGCSGERGLMSVAVSPDFSTTGHIYVDYSNNASGQIHVDELTVSGGSAALSSRRPLLTIEHPDADNHNGGQLQFGPEGDLYVSTGDGGGGNDEFHNSQNPDSLLGKLLRVDPNSATPAASIWSSGLRNPFRFSFDRETGDLVIGDVGQGAREEVDFAPRSEGGGEGANWGWNCREGFIEGPETDLPTGECAAELAAGAFSEPVFDYPHSGAPPGAAVGCAIIGGYVVRDQSLGDLYGRYLYGDLCEGELRSLALPATGQGRASGDRSEGLTVANLNSFGEDSCGRLYTVSGNGEVARLEGAAPASCPPPPPPPASGGGERPGAGPGPGSKGSPGHRRRARTHVRLAGRVGDRRGTATPVSLAGHVTPCSGRNGQAVTLLRGARPSGSRALGPTCRVSFHRVARHATTFRLRVPGTTDYLPGRSQRVAIP